jgi:hypothetical protein
MTNTEDFARKLEKSLAPLRQLRSQMESAAQEIQKLAAPYVDAAAKLKRDFSQAFGVSISPSLKKFAAAMEALPGRTRVALEALAKKGWYMDLDWPMPSLFEVSKALENGDVEEAEAALVEYYRSKVDEIDARLQDLFPNRRRILAKAFDAHRSGDYELSVPVLLVQADGVCAELIAIQLFNKQQGRPATAEYVDSLGDRGALLHPLAIALPIAASSWDRPADFDELNRHQVLHGEVLDYGTEPNSLKAISLIHYVATALKTTTAR